MIAKSAFLPTSMEPISFSHDSAFAPSMVAIARTCFAGVSVGFLFMPLCRRAVAFMVSNMSAVLFEHGLSVPSETVMPFLSIFGTGLMPEASLRFEIGLCEAFTFLFFIIVTSLSVNATQCAAITCLSRTPNESRYVITPFFNLILKAFWIFCCSLMVSATCVCQIIGVFSEPYFWFSSSLISFSSFMYFGSTV